MPRSAQRGALSRDMALSRVVNRARIFLAVTLAGAALIFAFGLWGDGPRGALRPTPLQPGADLDVVEPASDALRGRERRAAELAVPSLRSANATGASTEVGPTLHAAPPPGALRIVGRVLVDDEAPLPPVEARVRFHLGDSRSSRSRSLGEALVRGGAFVFDVPGAAVARMERLGARAGSIAYVLLAPGYEASEDEVEVTDAVDGVLHVELTTNERGLLVVGRVVTPSGDPVAAEVMVFDFGSLGQDLEQHELRADTAGVFQVALARGGFIDVIARHPTYGVAKVAGVSDATTRQLDLGDVVLEQRAVVSGAIVGFGRAPLGLHALQLEPLDDSGAFPWHEGNTDDSGHFRFACLDPIPYRVWIAGVDAPEEDVPVVTPDALDLEFFVPIASARVTVVGPDGAPVPNVNLAARAVQRVGSTWRVGGPGDAELRESESTPGVFHLTFSHSVTYSIAASATVEDVRWVAAERIEIGAEHRAVRLALEPAARTELTVEVTAPDGSQVPAWRVTFVDPATGVNGALATTASAKVALSPGTWTARVEPRGDTYVLPFQAEAQVTAETDQLTLRAPALGGKLTIRPTFANRRQWSGGARLHRVSGGFDTTLGLEEGKDATTPQALPAGDYEVIANGKTTNTRVLGVRRTATPSVSLPVTIRAGETAWLQLTVP